MSNDENIFEKLKDFLDLKEDSISILEQSIDSSTQLEYFEYSRSYIHYKSEAEIIATKDALFDRNMPLEDKKSILIELASLNNSEAYRTIERYLNETNINLYDWGYLALQESRLHLETNLLNENKVLITTGLGGKGMSLRYFVVLFSPSDTKLSEIQQNIIYKELQFYMPKFRCNLEKLSFEDSFASILVTIPIRINLKNIFKKVITECNLMGDFLYDDFIITNVKTLQIEEIRKMLRLNNIY